MNHPHNWTAVAALGALACVLVGIEGAGAQPSDSCLRMKISAQGKAIVWNRPQEEARQNAIRAWSAKAGVKAGPQYADWSKARGKSVNCLNVSKGEVACTATATPCR